MLMTLGLWILLLEIVWWVMVKVRREERRWSGMGKGRGKGRRLWEWF